MDLDDRDDLARCFPGIPAELVHEAAEAGKHFRANMESTPRPANRWAAFTTAELDDMLYQLNKGRAHLDVALAAETHAELARRKDTDGS